PRGRRLGDRRLQRAGAGPVQLLAAAAGQHVAGARDHREHNDDDGGDEIDLRGLHREILADDRPSPRHHQPGRRSGWGKPAGCHEYTVELDGHAVWPLPDSPYPPSVIRMLAPGAPLRLVLGSCRQSSHEALGEKAGYGPDALGLYAQRMARTGPGEWPDVLL